MPLTTRILENGSRNAKVLVTGLIQADLPPVKVFGLEDLQATALKIEGIVWVIQEKLGLRMWWGIGEAQASGIPLLTDANLIFVMESRNAVRLDHGLDSPRRSEKWDKTVWMDSFNFGAAPTEKTKAFTLIIYLDKQ